MKLSHWVALLFLVLLFNTAYIAAFATPTIFYVANVLLHVIRGIAVAAGFLATIRRLVEEPGRLFEG